MLKHTDGYEIFVVLVRQYSGIILYRQKRNGSEDAYLIRLNILRKYSGTTMTLTDILFQILIRPIEIILEIIYGIANTLTGNIGLSILVLSLFINIVLLPFYQMADVIQKEERDAEKKLEYWKNHINKTFSGDERFMMLRTYYRQNNYKPYYSLKSILPLVLEVPFFLAAYHFLSHLEELHGTSFLLFKDLGVPDGVLGLGGITLNLLPVLMTVINIISSSIYTKGAPLKEKIQLYGMAAIFLVLLYDSPSGLVLYWTANNFFSLLKNLIQSLDLSQNTKHKVLAGIGIICFVFILLFYHPMRWKHKAVALAVSVLLILPLVLEKLPKRPFIEAEEREKSENASLFGRGCMVLAVLTGILIPSAVVQSSPAEFILSTSYQSPLMHILNASLIAAGMFGVWFGVFYRLGSVNMRKLFAPLVSVLCIGGLVNYLFFGTDLGTLTPDLKFVSGISFSGTEKLLNLSVLVLIAVIILILYLKRKNLLKGILTIVLISITGLSVFNIVRIQNEMPEIRRVLAQTSDEKAGFTLRRNGQNVVILMLDRAVAGYLPYLMEEKPELQKQFAGFTYYPNTISYGAHTAVGAPALFGGYEYTPEEINARSDQSLVEKHDEALKVMPVLFENAGYEVTVCDPSYAGYSEIPDLSIYEEYPYIRTFHTENGQFRLKLLSEDDQDAYVLNSWKRNFFCYSMMKISPLLLQENLYKDGSYYNNNERSQVHMGMSSANGKDPVFVNSYSVLRSLSDMTTVSEEGKDGFVMLANLTTHSPTLLKEPEYELSAQVDNREYDEAHEIRRSVTGDEITLENYDQMSHYHVNMAALLALGDWFDDLRSQGVYDNTRIIIVADHGRDLGQFDTMILGEEDTDDVMFYNPLFMVKDFNSDTFTVDERFMTNADVPWMALQNVVDHPVNPFTGTVIEETDKRIPQHVYTGGNSSFSGSDLRFPADGWYAVSGDISDPANWQRLEEH